MRTATAAELTRLASAAFAYSVRVLIRDSESRWRNYSGGAFYADAIGVAQFVPAPPGGLSWVAGYHIDHDIDQPVSQLTVQLRREDGQTQNLALDGTFESGLALPNSSWSADLAGTTLSYETATPYAGLKSLKIVTTHQYGSALSPFFPVTPGDKWSVTAFAKSLAGKIADCQLMFLDANHVYIAGIQPTTTSAAWTAISSTGVVPAGAVYGRISLQCNDVGGGTVYFDNVDVRRVAVSLSPLRTDSLANRKSDGVTFEAAIDVGKSIRLEAADTPVGVDPNQPLQLDGSLEAGTAAGWTLGTGWSLDTTNPRTGLYALKHVASVGGASAQNPRATACSAGDRLYCEGYFKGVGGADGNAFVQIRWLDANLAALSASPGNAVASDGAYHLSSVLATAPANAAYALPEFRLDTTQTLGTWYADDLVCVWASWKRLFEGTIDAVEFNADPMIVHARDLGADLADRWLGQDQVSFPFSPPPSYTPTASPRAIEAVIQDLIDIAWDNGGTPDPNKPTLYTPTSPSFNVTVFGTNREPVLDALRRLVDNTIAWDLRYRWDDGTSAFRLTLFDPQRTKSVPDATIGPSQYLSVDTLTIDRTDVRNHITVWNGPLRDGVQAIFQPVSDAASIAKYGRRIFVITLGDDSPIKTSGEALTLANNVLADLKDPKADQTIVMLPFWPVELHDLLRFSPNAVHYNANQDLAVVRVQHRGQASEDGTAEHRTQIDVRGTPALRSEGWLDSSATGGLAGGQRMTIDEMVQKAIAKGNLLLFDQTLGVVAKSLSGQAFSETFEALPGDWSFSVGALADCALVTGVAETGQNVLRLTGNVRAMFPYNIPFDPSKLYRIRARIRQNSDPTTGGKLWYVGIAGVAADGETLVNTAGANSSSSQHYVCVAAASLTAGGALTEYTGWFKGVAASGSGVPSTDPTAPAALHQNVRYLRPYIIAGEIGGNGTADIDYLAIDVFDEDAQKRLYSAIGTDDNLKSGILPSAGVVEGSSSYQIYRHREEITVIGPDTDGDVAVSFALSYQNIPQVVHRGGRYVSFSNTLGTAGKQKLLLQVLDLTASGFTSRTQITGGGTITAQDDDFPSGNSVTTVGGTAVVTLVPGGAFDNQYTIHYFVTVTVDANAVNFCTATLTLAIDTNDGSGWQERATFSYSASPLSGPPPYPAATTTISHEQHAVTVSGLGSSDQIRIRAKSFVVTAGGTGSFAIRGGDGTGSNPETFHGATYNTSSGGSTESAIPDTGDSVQWAAQEVS